MANKDFNRLMSLDVLRGLTVAGMIIVNSMAAMKYGAGAAVFPVLLHAQWEGLTIADLVFPGFLMMVGVAIPFATATAQGGTASRGQAIVARAARLFFLGFLLSNLYWLADFSSGDWRLFGVLQRIGLVYGACALLFIASGPRVRMTLIAIILMLYWPLTLLPSLDGVDTDLWERGRNFAASIDRVLLGNHNYVKGAEGYDPEGLFSTLPAIAHGLIGISIGEYLMKRPDNSARNLAIAGLLMAVVGCGWGIFFPIVKDIWSSSFVLATCGIMTLILALLHKLLDHDSEKSLAKRAFSLFGLAFGVNAIAAYVLHQLTAPLPTWQSMLLPFQAARHWTGDGVAAFIPVLLYLSILWLCVEYLRRRRWIIKI